MVKGNQDHKRKKNLDNSSVRGHSRSKYKSKIVKCYKCQKKGHIRGDCLEWKRDKDEDNDEDSERSSRTTNIVAVDAN